MIHNKIVRPSFLIVQYVLQLVLVLFRFVIALFDPYVIFWHPHLGKAKQVRFLLMPHIRRFFFSKQCALRWMYVIAEIELSQFLLAAFSGLRARMCPLQKEAFFQSIC